MTTNITETYQLRPATMEDVEAVTALMNLCHQYDLGRQPFDVDETRTEFQEPGTSPEADMRLAYNEAGELAGAAVIYDARVPHVAKFMDVHVHPEHRGGELARQLIDWVLAEARRRIDRSPEGSRVFAAADYDLRASYTKSLWAGYGFEPKRYFFEMLIEFEGKEIPEPVWPEGYSISGLQPGEEQESYRVIFDAFKDHYGAIEDRPFEDAFERYWHFISNFKGWTPEHFLVVKYKGQPAAVTSCLPSIPEDPQKGYVATLGVRREHRRKGLALTMMRYAFRMLRAAGSLRAGLDVDAANPTGAVGLYEQAGMHADRTYELVELTLRDGVELRYLGENSQ